MRTSILALTCLLVIASAASAGLVGGYVFDGIPTVEEPWQGVPSTVVDIGGDASLNLTLGSEAIYTADTPFTYTGNTSLDVATINDRAYNATTTAYDFDLKNDAFSVSVWIKYSGDHGYQQVVSNRDNPGQGWFVGLGSDEKAFFWIASGADEIGASGGALLNDGAWHHIVAISDPNYDAVPGELGQLLLYVDGGFVDDYKRTTTGTPTNYGGAVFSVGNGLDGGGGYNAYAGLVDEVAIFNHALTGAEITALYSGTILPEPATLALLGIGGLVAVIRRRR